MNVTNCLQKSTMSSSVRYQEVMTALGPTASEDMGVTNMFGHLQVDAYDHNRGHSFVSDDECMGVREP